MSTPVKPQEKTRTVQRTPSVAVIIVNYRSAALTLDCLRSLADERLLPAVDLRAIVVENASGDAPALASAIRESSWESWVTLIEAPRNGGFAYGNNLGFTIARRHSRPDYLHMLNPDTTVKPGAVRALVEFLEEHADVGIAGSRFENADGSDWPFAFRFPSLLSEIEGGLQLGFVTRLLSRHVVARVMTPTPQPIDWGSGASLLIRSTVLDRIGGLDESFFLYFEETEFCWRAKRAGFATWYVPQSRVVHIGSQSTHVHEQHAALKRLPSYWFESRRRYFMLTYGSLRACLVDATALIVNALSSFRLALQRRRDRLIPCYGADLWRHSVLQRKNRTLQPPRTHLETASVSRR